jgi:hypothetical protein
MTVCVSLSDFKQPYSFPRCLSARIVVSLRSRNQSALGVYPIRALHNEGGAGRQRLAGLHGLMCKKGKTHQKFLLTAVTGSTRHPARDV